MTEEQKKNDATRYVIVKLPGRELCGVEDSEGNARAAAEDFAVATPGEEFAVYQKIGTAKLEPKVEWKGAAR